MEEHIEYQPGDIAFSYSLQAWFTLRYDQAHPGMLCADYMGTDIVWTPDGRRRMTDKARDLMPFIVLEEHVWVKFDTRESPGF